MESSKSVPNSAVKKIYPPIKRNKPIPQIVLDAGFNLDKLRDLARHRDPSVREAAVFVLGHMGEPEGVPIITSCAADPDNFVRESAARALGTIEYPFDSKEATGRMEDMREDRTAAAALLKLLKDREVNIRTAAAAALGNYGRQDVAKALLALAHDQSSSIRAAVATGLGGCPYTDVQAALIRMLQDDDFWTRLCAVRSLSRLLDPASLVPLLALLNDPNASVRANVARGLIEFHKAGLGTPSFWQLAGDSLLALTSSDTSEEVIGFAQEALLRISPKK